MPNNIPDGTLPSEFSSHYKAFTAERLHVYVQAQLSDSGYSAMADNAKLEIHRLASVDNAIVTMTSWMASGRVPSLERYETIKWPDGAWQMFKENHLPHWFKAKFPVRWHEQKVRVQNDTIFCCPHLQIDERNMHIQFMATGTDMARGFRRRDY